MINVPTRTAQPLDRGSLLAATQGRTQQPLDRNALIAANGSSAIPVSAYAPQPVNAGRPAYGYQQSQQPASAQPAYGYQQSQQPAPAQPTYGYQQSQQPAPAQPTYGYQQPQQAAPAQPAYGYQQPQQPASAQPAYGYQQPQQTAPAQPAYGYRQPAAAPAVQPAASSRPMPVSKPVPQLINKAQKGQKVPIENNGKLAGIKACLGWNVTNAECDVDVSAFMLGANGKVIGDEWFVFYGQTTSPDGSTVFAVDNGADRETITVDFAKLNPNVSKIVFVLTISDALTKRLNFGMLKDAYIRIMDTTGKELVSFLMNEYYNNVTSMMIGELYIHNGAWKFNAVGNGVAKDLAGLCELYGVQVV